MKGWPGSQTMTSANPSSEAPAELVADTLSSFRRSRSHTSVPLSQLILTVTHRWQVRFNNSTIDPLPRIAIPVDPWIVTELLTHFPDFRRAYEPDGLTVAEFDNYGATVRTLRSFINAYHDLTGAIRDVVLPDPDIQPGN